MDIDKIPVRVDLDPGLDGGLIREIQLLDGETGDLHMEIVLRLDHDVCAGDDLIPLRIVVIVGIP